MKTLLRLIDGHKTNILAAIAGLSVAMHLLGYIDEVTLQNIFLVLFPGGVYTFRDAIKKLEK